MFFAGRRSANTALVSVQLGYGALDRHAEPSLSPAGKHGHAIKIFPFLSKPHVQAVEASSQSPTSEHQPVHAYLSRSVYQKVCMLVVGTHREVLTAAMHFMTLLF
jgi:hypothetical protein